MTGQNTQSIKERCMWLAGAGVIKLLGGDFPGAETTATEGLQLLNQIDQDLNPCEAHQIRQLLFRVRRRARHPNPSRLRRMMWQLCDGWTGIAVSGDDNWTVITASNGDETA